MLQKSSRNGFSSARALLLLGVGTAFSSACVGEDAAPTPIPLPQPVSASRPPPPISGGTLLVTADNKTAIAADPDRDRVIIADLASKSVTGEIQLNIGDEPGRVVEGESGRVHVALLRAGAVATIDLAQKKLVGSTNVCAAPRGMAFDNGVLHVACAGGELVSYDPNTEVVVRRLKLGDDLRDVVVSGADLFVTRFRSAMLLRVDMDGNIAETRTLHPGGEFSFGVEAAVAWRMVKAPSGGLGIAHQSATTDVIFPDPGGYGHPGGCGEGIVNTFVSFGDNTPASSMTTGGVIQQAALPVDLAFSADGKRLAVVAAGSHSVLDTDVDTYRGSAGEFKECLGAPTVAFEHGQPIAVAFANSMRVVQTREPARLVLEEDEIIELGGEPMYDTGHAIFHEAANPALSMACASCHPHGHEDGRVWQFVDVGPRRTQSVAGGILATAPFHWAGDLDGFDSLMSDVFTGRMAGPELDPARKLAAAAWIDSIPDVQISPSTDAAAALRGKAIFEDAKVACATCHSGPRLTNNVGADVGTAGLLQVPSLRGLAARAPYMHDGCAATLEERFTNPACGGGDMHGQTSHLTPAQIADLVSYLETL
jgi:mono/diheme cytochrome c family protein